MLIQIEPDSNIPIYSQLVNQMIELIARNELQQGVVLPSVRTLAADIGVNMHTVNKAYHELEEKGIITIVPKSGAIVNAPSQKGIDPIQRERLLYTFQPLVAEALVLGMEEDELIESISTFMQELKETKL